MTLAEWLSEQKLTDDAFAERIGVSRSMVTKLRHRSTKPSFDSASRIMEATDRKVGWSDLMPLNGDDQAEAAQEPCS